MKYKTLLLVIISKNVDLRLVRKMRIVQWTPESQGKVNRFFLEVKMWDCF